MKWSEVDTSTLVFSPKRGGGTKVTQADGSVLRFRFPRVASCTTVCLISNP